MLMPSYLQTSAIRSPQQPTGNSHSHINNDASTAAGYVPMFQYQPTTRSLNRESYAEPASSSSGLTGGNKCRKCNGVREVCHCHILQDHVHSTQSTVSGTTEPTQFFELSSTSTAVTSTLSSSASCSISSGGDNAASQFIPNHTQRKTETETLTVEQENNNNNSNNSNSNNINERLVSIWPAAMDDHAVDEQLLLQSSNASTVVYELPSSSLLSSNASNTSSSFEANSSNNVPMTNQNSTVYDDVTSSASDTEHVQFANTRTTNTTTTTSAQKKKHSQNRSRNLGAADATTPSTSTVIELDATPSTSAQAQHQQQRRQQHQQHQHENLYNEYCQRRLNQNNNSINIYELEPIGDNSSDDGWDLRTHNASLGPPAGSSRLRPQSSTELDARHADHTYYNSRGYVNGVIALPPPPLPPDGNFMRSTSASCTTATHTTCSVDYGGRDICGVHRLTMERGNATPISEQQQRQRPAAVLKACYNSGLGSGIVRTRSRVRSMDEAMPASSSSRSSTNSLCQPPRKLARLEAHNDLQLSPSTMSSLSPTNFYAFQPGRHRHRTYAELARTSDLQVRWALV